jgi:hypothetical protein
VRLEQELLLTADLTPERIDQFQRDLPTEWIEEALYATGTATVRRRRLPSEQVVWLVLGMALMRDRPISDVVDKLDLALPRNGVAQARARLGDEPMEWLFLRSADAWAHESANRHRWRGLALYGVDGSTLRVPDSDENRDDFGGQSAGQAGRLSARASGRVDGASFASDRERLLRSLRGERVHLCGGPLALCAGPFPDGRGPRLLRGDSTRLRATGRTDTG